MNDRIESAAIFCSALGLAGFAVQLWTLQPPSPQQGQRLSDQIVVISVSVSILLLLVAFLVRDKRKDGKPGMTLSPVVGEFQWTPNQSWASNLVALGSAVNLVSLSFMASDGTAHLATKQYQILVAVFALLALLAPTVTAFHRRSSTAQDTEVPLLAFAFAALLTLIAGFGELNLLALLTIDAHSSTQLRTPAFVLAMITVCAVYASLCGYVVRAIAVRTSIAAVPAPRGINPLDEAEPIKVSRRALLL